MKLIRNLVVLLAVALTSFSAFAAPVDINKASAIEISEAMKGIGDSKAEAIVTFREENGAFKSVDELVLVKGIGEKTIEKNRDNIFVSKE